MVKNPTQADFDVDGIGDACDYRNARCFLLGYLNCIHAEECRAYKGLLCRYSCGILQTQVAHGMTIMRRWSLADGGPQSRTAGCPQAGEFGPS